MQIGDGHLNFSLKFSTHILLCVWIWIIFRSTRFQCSHIRNIKHNAHNNLHTNAWAFCTFSTRQTAHHNRNQWSFRVNSVRPFSFENLNKNCACLALSCECHPIKCALDRRVYDIIVIHIIYSQCWMKTMDLVWFGSVRLCCVVWVLLRFTHI